MREGFGTGNEQKDDGEYNDEMKRVDLPITTESDCVGLLVVEKARKEDRCLAELIGEECEEKNSRQLMVRATTIILGNWKN